MKKNEDLTKEVYQLLEKISKKILIWACSEILNQALLSINIKIQIPDSEVVEGKGKVVWVIPRKIAKAAQKTYDIGIEFTDFDVDGQKRLIQYLAARPD